MGIRIEQMPLGNGTELRVEGDLVGEAVEVLQDYLLGIAVGQRLTLDLRGVRHADRQGAHLLHEAALWGHAISGASPYIELLIERAGE